MGSRCFATARRRARRSSSSSRPTTAGTSGSSASSTATGGSASWTGPGCLEWAGHRNGFCYAAQGNILVGAETVDAIATTFESNAGQPLARRLIDCLGAAQVAGGDRRGQQCAALLVVERDGGYAKLSDSLVDLRVDDHERPIDELRRLYALHDRLFGVTPREDWLPLEGELRAEVSERLARLGYDSLDSWAGVANLEERVEGESGSTPWCWRRSARPPS